MEAYHLRKVLEVLGHSYNLKMTEDLLQHFTQDYTSRVLITDFEKHYLSGFPTMPKSRKFANIFKKRLDGFLYAGRDTFERITKQAIASQKPIEYHKHKLNLKLNEVSPQPGFDMQTTIYAYSAKVKQMR